MLPFDASERLICFLCMSYFLCDTVLLPKLLDLFETLFAEVQRIPASESLISFSIIIQIGRRIETALGFTGQEEDLAFSYSEKDPHP